MAAKKITEKNPTVNETGAKKKPGRGRPPKVKDTSLEEDLPKIPKRRGRKPAAEKVRESDFYSEEFSEKAYDLDDIRAWLQDCKFEVVAVYEEMTEKPVKADTQRAVFVAKKIGTQ